MKIGFTAYFLGRKLRGNFEGQIVSDLSDLSGRIPECRIKHRVKENWLKMYDKAGLVLRVETVINNPDEFKVRKKVIRNDKVEWVPMRKGIAYLFRYQQVSLQANSSYLEALERRDQPKDAYDLCYCLDEYPGGLAALAEGWRSRYGDPLVDAAVRILREKFASVGHYGSRQLAAFHDPTDADERAMHARCAYELMKNLLNLL